MPPFFCASKFEITEIEMIYTMAMHNVLRHANVNHSRFQASYHVNEIHTIKKGALTLPLVVMPARLNDLGRNPCLRCRYDRQGTADTSHFKLDRILFLTSVLFKYFSLT